MDSLNSAPPPPPALPKAIGLQKLPLVEIPPVLCIYYSPVNAVDSIILILNSDETRYPNI